MIKKYRKKPVMIEAVQWTGANWNEVCDFLGVPKNGRGRMQGDEMLVDIETLEGTMTARQGDFIIKGIKDEFYPCKPDIFEQTYEECSNANK